jgi:hypothetical protein
MINVLAGAAKVWQTAIMGVHRLSDRDATGSAFSVPDGVAARGSYYGFIKQTFRELHKKSFTYLRTTLAPPTTVGARNNNQNSN